MKNIKFFKKKAEALKGVATNKHLFMEDIFKGGAKRFLVSTEVDVYNYMRYNFLEKNMIPHIYEGFIQDQPVNFTQDLDIKDPSEIKNHKEIIRKVIDKTICRLKRLTNEVPEVISLKAKVQQKGKISYHLIYRLHSYIFRDMYQCKEFAKQLNLDYECLDLCIYRMGALRTCFSSKKGYSKGKQLVFDEEFSTYKYITDEELFINSLSIHRGKSQENLITIVPAVSEPPAIKKVNSSSYIGKNNCKLLEPLLKLLYGRKVSYSYSKKNDTEYVNITDHDKCYLCNKTHSRCDGNYLQIFTSYKSALNIIMKCWKYDEYSKYKVCVNRNGKVVISDDLQSKVNVQDVIDEVKKVYSAYGDRYDPYTAGKLKSFNIGHEYQKKICNSKHIKNISIGKNVNTVVIKSNMGTGKSTFVSEYIKKNNKKPTMCIAPLISLNYTLKDKLEKFDVYKDMHTKDILSSKKLIITPDSLIRLYKEEIYEEDDMIKTRMVLKDPPEILWLDEYMTLMKYMDSNHMKHKKDVMEILEYYIKYSKKVIITDADINNDALETLSLLRPKGSTKIIWNKRKTADRTIFVYYEAAIYKTIDDRLNHGKKLYVCTDINLKGKHLYEHIRQKYPSKKVAIYNSDTPEFTPDGSPSKADFLDCNKYWKKYDVVICSPTVQVGMDFSERYFDYVFGLFSGTTVTARTAHQMLGRVRQIIRNKIYISFIDVPYRNIPTDKKSIYRAFVRNSERAYLSVKKNKSIIGNQYMRLCIKETFNCKGKRIFDDKDFISNLIINNRIEEAESKNKFDYILLSYLHEAGNKVFLNRPKLDDKKIPSTSSIRKEIKVIRENEVDQYVKDIIRTPLVDQFRYEVEKQKPDKNDFVIKKFIYHATYGISRMIRDIDKAKFLYNDTTLERFRNYRDIIRGIPYRFNRNVAQYEVNKFAFHHNVVDLLKVVGFKDLTDSKTLTYTSESKIKLPDNLLKDIYINCNTVGRFRGSEDSKVQIVNLLKRLLKHYYNVEINVKKKRSKKKKKEITIYEISLVHCSTFVDLLRRIS